MMKIYRLPTCPHCGEADTFALPEADVKAWQDGRLIQEVFYYLTPGERERMISGIHPQCWDAVFQDD